MAVDNYINLRNKKYPVIPKPVPHILVSTKKELHGWAKGKRECNVERMLINPYNGCSIGCFYCYSLSYPGYFQIFRNKGIIVVAENFDKVISEQLDSIDVATCGYLSPITDPFQPINSKYKLSEKIIDEFINRNIPIQVTTKSHIPNEVLDKIKIQKHSFIQVSILTFKERVRKMLVPKGANTDKLFDNIKRARERNIFSVARIDPIFPYVTDDFLILKNLVKKLKDSGVSHIVISILDIPLNMKYQVLKKISFYFGRKTAYNYKKLYVENIDGWLNAKIDYRRKVFDYMANLCDKENMSFALCMEYELRKDKICRLNKEFSNSINCDGTSIPVYIRKKDKFFPTCDCNGNCLDCKEAKCGIPDLAMGRKRDSKKNWNLNDYKRWSKQINQRKIKF